MSKLRKGWNGEPRRLGGMTSCAALRVVRKSVTVSGDSASGSGGRIALFGVLCRKTLIGERWIEDDLYVYRELGTPTVQPKPLEADVILDGRSPTPIQIHVRLGPSWRVVVNWVTIEAVTAQRHQTATGVSSAVSTAVMGKGGGVITRTNGATWER